MAAWSAHAIKELEAGRPVEVRPSGRSMEPRVRHRARVKLKPIEDPASLSKGEVVLVRVSGTWYLHLISATDHKRVQISNNRGRVNGWVARSAVLGRAVEIDNGGERSAPASS